MKYAEIRKQLADAQRALKEERDFKVTRLKQEGVRFNTLSIRLEVPNDGGRHYDAKRMALYEEKTIARMADLLLVAGVLERHTELSKHGDESIVTFSLHVGTQERAAERGPLRPLRPYR